MIKKQKLANTLLLMLAGLPMLGAALSAAAADISKGGQLYSMHCANCHGGSGIPMMPGSPNFQRSEKLFQSDAMLLASIRRGKNAMPAYAGMLRDQEIMDVIAYLRTMQR